MTTGRTSAEQNTAMDVRIGGCERFHKALCDCHRRIPAGPARDAACRHINRSLADCMVAAICPAESDAVRSFCSSGGTSLKRSQCQDARLSLSVCLASHQHQTMEPQGALYIKKPWSNKQPQNDIGLALY